MLAEISITDSLQRTVDQVGDFLPNLVGAIVIFIIGWIVARIIRRVVHAALTRVGIDALVDRSGLGGPLERAGYPDSGLFLARIVYLGIMLIVLQLTADALAITAIKDVLDDMVAFIPRLFVAIIIVFLTGAVANFVRETVAGFTTDLSWGNTATSAATAAVWIIGGFAALDQIQVAEDIVDILFQAMIGALALIMVIKFGVGGIWAARDRFWPAVYDKISPSDSGTPTPSA